MKTINVKLFLVLYFSFILATVVGTFSHECGHFLAAKYRGFDSKISYASTQLIVSDPHKLPTEADHFFVRLGGPLQTMASGSLGLLLLFLFCRTIENTSSLSFLQWGLIFITLFWLRQLANLCVWYGMYFTKGSFSESGDEIGLANDLNLPSWSIITITGIMGAIVLALVVFKFIPREQRNTFLVAGFFGGISGYLIWLNFFGKYILP